LTVAAVGSRAGFARDVARNVGRITPLAWPVLVGQLAVLAYGTIDTVLIARYSTEDLAAYAVGGAAYITTFIGLMGVVLGLSPIVGQLFGAKKLEDAGAQVHQAVWVALGLSLIGCALLAFPAPFLAVAKAGPEVVSKVRGYLWCLVLSLPMSLLFTVFRGFNNAVSRPKAVMVLQLAGLAVKAPLSVLFIYGAGPVPALGVTGCGLSTAIAVWMQALIAWQVLKRDPFYKPFKLTGRGLDAPNGKAIRALLRLGVPIGGAILIEVTGFAFMALFISRIGTTAVAGHQIVANLVSVMFMLPLALGNATSTLVAQRVGAGDHADARGIAWHGVGLGVLLAVALSSLVFGLRESVARLYTTEAAVLAITLPLLGWLVWFHVVDAVQCVTSFVLRAYKIATLPLVIYVGSLCLVGLGGGYALAFNLPGNVPEAWQGTKGFWIACTVGLACAALGLVVLMAWTLRHKATPSTTASHSMQP
jgi:multidrug resistance protein, MATE family